MNITDLSKLEHGTILRFEHIDKEFTKRLMDLGIYEGAHVILLNKLSFNRLFLIEVDDIEICLRKEDAKKIEVKR